MSSEGEKLKREEAMALFQQAYQNQMQGDLEEAIELYKRSIDIFPTAEGHTFLGWTYSFQGRWDEAIEECLRAIEVDPTFGNPYNDIGAYLVEKDRLDEAIPWFERALKAPRYESYCFPHFNLGRVHERKRMFSRALAEYKKAYQENPQHLGALQDPAAPSDAQLEKGPKRRAPKRRKGRGFQGQTGMPVLRRTRWSSSQQAGDSLPCVELAVEQGFQGGESSAQLLGAQ